MTEKSASIQLPKSVTIKEVARHLNVSPSTISRALGRPELLSEETRKRVLEAVETLGYQPNLIARGLRMQETRLLFVVVPTLSPFFLEVFRGVERAAVDTGYAVLMGHTERDPDREHRFFDQVASQRADGIILVTSSDHERLVARERRMPPVVVALEHVEGLHAPTVRVDHRKGGVDATNHLLALGHRRIAHVAGPKSQAIAQQRRLGFQEAMVAAGLDPDAYPVVAGPYAVVQGESAMEKLLACNPPPTAIFAGNDELAIGVVRTAKRVGLEVGRDISVIGFDDQRIANLYEPALTTVKVPTEELGYQAALSLIRGLQGRGVQEDVVLPTSIVIRATTGHAPR